MKKAKFTIIKTISVATTFICRLTGHHGTSFPGVISKLLFPDILREMSEGVLTVLVTGTNGKSATVSFIGNLLDSDDVFINSYGSNLESGIITAFLKNMDRSGKPVRHTAVMECDEYTLPVIAKHIKHPVIAVLNVFPEQEERYGSASEVTAAIAKGIEESQARTLCLNMDRPGQFADIADRFPQKKILSFSRFIGNAADISVSENNGAVRIRAGGREYLRNFTVPGSFNVSNLAAALAVLTAMGRLTENEIDRIEMLKPLHWHMQTLDYGDHKLRAHLVKNTECIDQMLALTEKEDSIVCFFFDRSEVDGTSDDWIKAANVSHYKSRLANSICVGDFSGSMLKVLISAGITGCRKMSVSDFFCHIEKSPYDLTVFANVKAMNKLRKKAGKRAVM